jgi:ubiquinone/menaquinone biosynthesis C-methylase UbiE
VLTELLHRAASHAVVYDAIQLVAGAAPLLEKRLAENLGHLPSRPTILDVGGGTGLPPSLWPEGTTYVCLDIDSLKLAGFVGKKRPGSPVQADATRLPLRGETVDLVVCKNVSHHLTDEQLPRLFGESARVLKRGGRMLFIDAVLAPERFRSRLLWRYDRGSHPRTSEVLKEAMAAELNIDRWEDFAHHFRYVFLAGVKQ